MMESGFSTRLLLTSCLSLNRVPVCSVVRYCGKMPQYTAEYIKRKLEKELDAVHVSIEDISDGCGAKFNAIIVSPKFDGQPLLQRHRMVNGILEDEMKTIHAFSQKTLTPEQWEKQKN